VKNVLEYRARDQNVPNSIQRKLTTSQRNRFVSDRFFLVFTKIKACAFIFKATKTQRIISL